MRRPLDRRTLLRGAGAMLSVPFLEALSPRSAKASEAGKPPLRMAIYTATGGTVLESWKPAAEGKLDELPSILRPLDFCKDQMLVLSGLSQNGRSEGNLNAHEHCSLLHLTGGASAKKVNGRMISSISVDQAAAKAVGDQTYLPSLEIGLSNNETKYSFRSADAPLQYEPNPRIVFDRMFRNRTPVSPNWRKRAERLAQASSGPAATEGLDRSVVDIVRGEAKDLERALGVGDRRRLDEYLHSVRAIEKRIDFMEARQRVEALDAADPGPTAPLAVADLPPEGTSIWKITNPVMADPERHGDYIRMMSDLFILGFQTDTTRVATLAVGDDGAMFPGVVTVGYERHCHTLEHQGNAARVEDADPIAREACRQIHAWYTELFAEMVRKMQSIDEGGSTLLDNTMLLYTSYMADGGHGRDEYPMLLVGKAGGTLNPGRHIAYPKRTPVANLYLEMLDRMGAGLEAFGESHTSEHRRFDGRLPGLV